MKSEKKNIRQIANESNREHNFEICFEIYIFYLTCKTILSPYIPVDTYHIP